MGAAGSLRVAVVAPHPDDETFGVGGTTAVLAARGVEVRLIIVTDGDAGEITAPELQTAGHAERLATLRREESRAAARITGALEPVFLGLPDGRLPDLAPGVLEAAIAAALAEADPDVVITMGPEGIYGHPDHIAVSEATTRAFDALAPVRPRRLFYQVISARRAARINRERGPVMLSGVPHPFVGYEPGELGASIDVTAVAQTKLAALRAHRSQTAGMDARLEEMVAVVPLYEHYVLARGEPTAGIRRDLMAGLTSRRNA